MLQCDEYRHVVAMWIVMSQCNKHKHGLQCVPHCSAIAIWWTFPRNAMWCTYPNVTMWQTLPNVAMWWIYIDIIMWQTFPNIAMCRTYMDMDINVVALCHTSSYHCKVMNICWFCIVMHLLQSCNVIKNSKFRNVLNIVTMKSTKHSKFTVWRTHNIVMWWKHSVSIWWTQ